MRGMEQQANVAAPPRWLWAAVWVLGVALRLVAVFRREMFVDELHALYVAHGGLGSLWQGLVATPGIAPLDYGVVKVLSAVAGDGRWLRLPMMAVQLLGIWHLGRLAARWRGDGVAFWAVALCLLSPLLIDHSASLRPYAGAFAVGVCALGWLGAAPGSARQALVRGAIAAVGVGYQFFLAPVVLLAMGLGGLKAFQDKAGATGQWRHAALSMVLPLVVFLVLSPLWAHAGDMRSGRDNPAAVVLALVQIALSFSGWGALPVGIVVAVAAWKGRRALPQGGLLFAVVLLGVILAGELKAEVGVLARHYAPLFPVFALTAAATLCRWNGRDALVSGLLTALLVVAPLNNERCHPRIWLMGLDLRSDFSRDLPRWAGTGEKPHALVTMGFLDGFWRFVLNQQARVRGLEDRLQFITPAQIETLDPAWRLSLVIFRVPPYMDPASAPLSALGLPPPVPTRGEDRLGSFGQVISLEQASPKAPVAALIAVEAAYRHHQPPVPEGPFEDQFHLNNVVQNAGLLCRLGKHEVALQDLLVQENTVKARQGTLLRPLGVAWAQVMDRCLEAVGEVPGRRVAVLRTGAGFLGVPSGALRVQSGWSARRYYEAMARVAGQASDEEAAALAHERLQALGPQPATEPPMWP